MRREFKNVLMILMSAVMVLGTLVGCGQKESVDSTKEANEEVADTQQDKVANINGLDSDKYYICIEFEKYDPIYVELDAVSAPKTVANFLELVNEGFYDGLTFHRIISGFMMQGGDPTGTGMGGSGKEIKGEFLQNGVLNTISHERGVISMARSQMPDSASSQFFIVHEDSLFLDGAYAGFGHVLKGIETVDAICADTPVQDGNGSVAPEDQPVIKCIKEIKLEDVPN